MKGNYSTIYYGFTSGFLISFVLQQIKAIEQFSLTYWFISISLCIISVVGFVFFRTLDGGYKNED